MAENLPRFAGIKMATQYAVIAYSLLTHSKELTFLFFRNFLLMKFVKKKKINLEKGQNSIIKKKKKDFRTGNLY